MAIADQSGFEAIQSTIPEGPYARRKIIRGPDGTPQVILVDQAGNTISDASGYGIVDSGNYLDPKSLGTPDVKSNNPQPTSTFGESTAKRVIDDASRGEKDTSGSTGNSGYGRNQGGNFGYVNKPGALGLASAIPGPIGMAGKAVNMGINANNAAAVNAARQSMGLEGIGIGGAVKSTLRDNKGQVADVTMEGSQYATPVGLEAMSPEGMTNMTPAEAAARARAVGGMTISTPEQVAARNKAFEAEFSKPGLLSRVSNVATSFVSNLFGTNSDDDFKPTQSGFSDMIGDGRSSSNSSGTRTGTQANTNGQGIASLGSKNRSEGIGHSNSGGSGGTSNPGTSGNMGKGGGTTSGHGPGIGSA